MKCTLVLPPGSRSCTRLDGQPGSGGTWALATCGVTGVQWNQDDLASLDAKLADDDERAVVKQEIALKFWKAANGMLTFQRSKDQGEYDVKQIRDHLLEMVFTDNQDLNDRPDGLPRYQVRVYFTEPEQAYKQLLLLRVAAKAPGKIGLREQDEHIKEALMRMDQHYATPVRNRQPPR